MICRDARELLSAWIDEQLAEAEELSVRAHLEGCVACRALARELESTVAAVRSLPRIEAAPDFTARVVSRAQRHEERRAWWRGLVFREPGAFVPAPALRVAAALVLGLLAGYGAAQWNPGRSGPAPLAVDTRSVPGESLGTASGATDLGGTRPGGLAAGEIDYVLDRYTVVHGGPPGAQPMRPVLANQDVPVRF